MRFILSNDTAKSFEVDTTLIELGSKDRVIQSAKKFFLFFIIATIAVFVPVLHFFLVPVFLFLSFFAAIKTYSIKYRLNLKDSRDCPNCHKPLNSFYLLKNELKFKCDNCNSRIIVFEHFDK